ncbi:TonB-dependent receptor domain-containing protein [Robertkochia sediminum]|uniref:TonB-dependent receptor domain-containing protein n=1 Tax=Robertkochia sediminum TaxID=2785326 RepID=UPI0019337E98|nr:TonB-dependent receptor [Robertkochia sediminum]MBL7473431.1 TonB-dependent receptor [Robertkochia sediminum]
MKQDLKTSTALVLLLFSTFTLFAQSPGSDPQRKAVVTGKVIDADNGAPLEFATLVLQSAENPDVITGGVTDANGNFEVEAPSGRYDIRVEFISYKSYEIKNRELRGKVDLGTITLALDVATLEAVEITAERTTVEIKLDKKVYNVGKDLTNAGATISDALNNVPSVAVDIEGGISLRGNENVRILINGRPSALAGFGSTDALQQLPADAIERIEVITSPSARYDAEGTAGILNIVLKRDKTLGFNGSVQLNGGYPARFQATSNLNYRTKKFNFFNTIGYRYRNSPGRALNDNVYNPGSSNFDRIIEERDWDRTSSGFNFNIGTEYFISDQTSVTASFFTRFSDGLDLTTNLNDRFYADGSFDQTVSTEEENEEDRSYQTSLNFRHNFNEDGHNLTVDLQYSVDKEDVTTPIEERIYAPQELVIRDDDVFEVQEQNDYLVQADYVLPIGDNARFEAGYRGSFENSETDYLLQGLQLDPSQPDFGEVVINFGLTNVFNFEQNINAFYTQYGNKFGKFSFLAGLRLENTRLIGSVDFNEEEVDFPFDPNFDKNFLGLFPTANLTWEFEENENITLGYNRRINRPRSWQINPFPSQSSRTNIFQGNPALNPAYANTFDLGYLKRWEKLTLTTSVYFQRETDSFEWITEETGQVTSDNIPILRRTPINLSSEERYGAEAAVLWNPARWVRINSSANVFRFVKTGEYNGTDFGASNLSWFARMNAKVTLPGKIDWQTNAFYRGPSENAQSRTEGLFILNLAFAKDILNDNATVSFNVSDLFNSGIRRSVSETPRVTSTSETQWRVRQWQVGFVYRFNQSKRDAQRNRGGGDYDDEGGGY